MSQEKEPRKPSPATSPGKKAEPERRETQSPGKKDYDDGGRPATIPTREPGEPWPRPGGH